MSDWEDIRRARLEEEARINAEAIGEEIERQRVLEARKRASEESDRRDWEASQQRIRIEEERSLEEQREKANAEHREYLAALEEERQYHAEQLEEERQKHEEKMFEKQERARKLAEREAISLCYNSKGEKILGIYDGELKNGLPNGKGILNCDDGDIYEGEFLLGRFYGNGKSIRGNGALRYEGEYKNGLFDGQGVYYYRIGEKGGRESYSGSFLNGKREGKGKLVWVDGTYYEGSFHNNEMDGFGVMIWPNGDVYEGEFKEGMRDGVGKYISSSGNSYEGEWSHGKREGKGYIKYTDGWRSECIWKNDEPYTGIVRVFRDDHKTLLYEGEMVEGLWHGRGTVYCTGNSEGKVFKGEIQHGQWKKGAILYANGNVQYDGEWKDGNYHGLGSQYNEQGVLIRQGMFDAGKQQGKGCTYYHYIYNKLAYTLKGDFEQGSLKYGVCEEGLFSASGEFNNNTFSRGRVSYNKCLVFEGSLMDETIKVYYNQMCYECQKCVLYPTIVYVGCNGNVAIRIDISLKDGNSVIGIKEMNITQGTVSKNLCKFSKNGTVEAFVLDGSGYYIINDNTKLGELHFNPHRTNLFDHYSLADEESEHMIVKGKFVDFKIDGESNILNSNVESKISWQEKATFVNGYRDGAFQWHKIDVDDRSDEQIIFGEYRQGKIVDWAKIKYLNNSIVEEYIGHIDKHGDPNGLGIMKLVHYDDSIRDITYGLWNGISCEKSIPYIWYKLCLLFDKHNLI